MMVLRPGAERGHVRQGWLESYHSFSFASYHNPAHMGFHALRVINEDHVQPGQGFAPHSHRDMEIITYVLAGALEHKDSLGNGSVMRHGDVQRMSAGTGITHSEYNHSKTEPVHLLQIWILPRQNGIQPGYEQRTFNTADRRGRLCLIAAHDAREGAVMLHQDADVFASVLVAREHVIHALKPRRHAWLQVAGGSVELNGVKLEAGDGAALSDEAAVDITGLAPESEFLLFDLAG